MHVKLYVVDSLRISRLLCKKHENKFKSTEKESQQIIWYIPTENHGR